MIPEAKNLYLVQPYFTVQEKHLICKSDTSYGIQHTLSLSLSLTHTFNLHKIMLCMHSTNCLKYIEQPLEHRDQDTLLCAISFMTCFPFC